MPQPRRLQVSAQNILPIVLAVVIASLVFAPGSRAWLEQRLQAFWLLIDSRSSQELAAPLTLVAIDEASIDALGPWPWPRSTWASLIDRLRTHHSPVLLAIDAVFPPVPDQAAGNQAFAQELAASPAVVGQLLLPEPGLRGAAQWATLNVDDDTLPASGLPALRFPGLLGNEPVLEPSARVGHINARVDVDGAMRVTPTVICTDNKPNHCSISFLQAMVSQLTGTTSWTLERGGWLDAEWLLRPDRAETFALPVNSELMLTIPWRRPSGLRYVSAADVWHNTLDRGLLDHDIVLFGGVSLGLGDVATSPLHTTVPGMEVHAQLLRGWLYGALPYQPRYAGPLMALVTILLAVLLVANARHTRRLALVTTAGVALPLLAAAAAWTHDKSMLPAAAPAAFAFMAGGILLIRQMLRDRTQLLNRAATYLPRPLRQLLMRPDAQVPNETGWGTIMVADILGYTAQSQRLALQELAQWCDTGINYIVKHAQDTGAMLDNVAGDGAMLLWRNGTKAEQAAAAVTTACAILNGLDELNAALAARRLPPLAIGMGIHAGPYLLGSLGKEQKRYTVVSEAANLAAHIERQTRRHPWPILLSKTIAQLLPGALTREVSVLEFERQAAIKLYTLSGTVGNNWPHRDNVSNPASTP